MDDLDLVLAELRRRRNDGEIEAETLATATVLARRILTTADRGVPTAAFAAAVARLAEGGVRPCSEAPCALPETVALVLGTTGLTRRIAGCRSRSHGAYRAVGAAYGLTAWVYEDDAPERCEPVRRHLLGDRPIDEGSAIAVDRAWSEGVSAAQRSAAEAARWLGADGLRALLRTNGRRSLAKAATFHLADHLPDHGVSVSAPALRAVAIRDLGYPH